MSLIRLENVSLARQGKTLLSNLNWSVEKGQTWAILGLNGAGKSTLLRLLTAEFFPFEGHAEILGYTFGNGDITGLRKHIGIVSSFITERLPKHMTAEKIVLTGIYDLSNPQHQVRSACPWLLATPYPHMPCRGLSSCIYQ